MSEFSDRPLVAGSLIGVRAFDVDALGRLIGPTYPQVFTPDENVASCHMGNSTAVYRRSVERAAFARANGRPALPAELPPPRQTHQVGQVKCGCGFYAYFDGSNTYGSSSRVTAIIEGYGVCSVGERGFRAEKARLVALVIPSSGGRIHTRYDKTADWCEAHDGIEALLGLGALFVGVGTAVGGVAAWSWLITPPLVVIGLAFIGFCAWMMKASFHGISREYASLHPEIAHCPVPPPKARESGANREAIAANYPDVPVYRTLKAALAAHPLTVPDPPVAPTPETHEDFWTMEVPR